MVTSASPSRGSVRSATGATNGSKDAANDAPAGSVLIIDDDAFFATVMERQLSRAGFTAEVCKSATDGLKRAQEAKYHLVCLDLGLPDSSGFETLEKLLALPAASPVVILTADNAVNTVVGAMQLGAYDYLTKPIDTPRLLATARNAVEKHRLEHRVAVLSEDRATGYRSMIGNSAAMRGLYTQIERVGPSEVTTAIHGESGAGKELVARAVHDASRRHAGPFVALNCAAIPETLQESELFGHEKGSFTGAFTRRIGRLEQADGGTLFLDEVAELSLTLQAKLLRCLQERTIRRVGGSQDVATDFRLVTATHKNLSAEVAAGRFREDLYYRLAVFELELPPLRDRLDDLPLLVRHFLAPLRDAAGKPLQVAQDAMETLYGHTWKGNVRELQNVIQHAAVVAREGVIRRGDLPARLRDGESVGREAPARALAPVREPAPRVSAPMPSNAAVETPLDGFALPALPLAELERLAIRQAIHRHRGNMSAAIRELGIGRTTLYRKLQEYGLSARGVRQQDEQEG